MPEKAVGPTARTYVLPFVSVTVFTVDVASFQPTTTTFKSPAVWAPVYVVATDDEVAVGLEFTCTKAIAGGGGAVVTVTVAFADLLVSACAIAVTVTVAGLGTVAGAVYRPAVEIVPTVEFPPVTPFTCHVTAVLLLPVTVAVNCCVVLTTTDALVGEMLTPTVVRVTVALADLVVSACDTAVTVTVFGLGTAAGAVYRPAVEIVPTVALPPVTPFTCQVTAVFVVPV